ncbi:MAG: GNAT family N-acetyltransferase [Planctomycetota bacterium]
MNMNDSLRIRRVDYRDPTVAAQLVDLLDDYARSPGGGGQPLSDEVKQALPERLAEFSGAFSFIAYLNDRPVGLINCLTGFSTFKAMPLMNVHDVTVRSEFRGNGIARELFRAAEQEAVARGCCKVTLEVLENNTIARQAYQRLGYAAYELDPQFGHALFMEKALPAKT